MRRVLGRVVTVLWVICCGSVAIGRAEDIQFNRSPVAGGELVTYLRLGLNTYSLKVLTPPSPYNQTTTGSGQQTERASTGYFLRDYLARFKALAVMTGSYVVTYAPPTALGVVKSAGTTSGIAHASWSTEATVCSDGKKVTLTRTADSNPADFPDCLQTGPMLLVNRAPSVVRNPPASYNNLSNAVTEHGFMCIDSQNEIIMGQTTKLTLSNLTEFLRSPNMGCVNATRLDAGGLMTNAQSAGDETDSYLLPSAIGVFLRQ